MAGLLRRATGAALAGLGAGIVQHAAKTREESLLRLRRRWQTEDSAASDALTREGWDRDDRRAAASRDPTETFETADNPFGRGGVGQRSTTSGRIVNYQALPSPKGAPGTVGEYIAGVNAGIIDPDAMSLEDYVKAGRSSISVGGPSKAPAGYRNVQDSEGNWALEAIPGGPAAAKTEGAEAKETGRAESEARKTSFANTHIAAIRRQLDEATLPTTGFGGSFVAGIPGTVAHDMSKRLDTLKAMIGFNALNEMRANSPTGGALGNVTERELGLLQATIGSLEQSQSEEQFRENLALVESAFNKVIHGGDPRRGDAPSPESSPTTTQMGMTGGGSPSSQPPVGYPDARWSGQHGAFFVQRNGRWNRVD